MNARRLIMGLLVVLALAMPAAFFLFVATTLTVVVELALGIAILATLLIASYYRIFWTAFLRPPPGSHPFQQSLGLCALVLVAEIPLCIVAFSVALFGLVLPGLLVGAVVFPIVGVALLGPVAAAIAFIRVLILLGLRFQSRRSGKPALG